MLSTSVCSSGFAVVVFAGADMWISFTVAPTEMDTVTKFCRALQHGRSGRHVQLTSQIKRGVAVCGAEVYLAMLGGFCDGVMICILLSLR